MPWHRAAAAMAYAYLFKYIIIGDTGEARGAAADRSGGGGPEAGAEGQTASGRGAGLVAAGRLPAAPFPQCWSW